MTKQTFTITLQYKNDNTEIVNESTLHLLLGALIAKKDLISLSHHISADAETKHAIKTKANFIKNTKAKANSINLGGKEGTVSESSVSSLDSSKRKDSFNTSSTRSQLTKSTTSS